MTQDSLRIYLKLVRQFRNAPELISAIRSGTRCECAVTWSGRKLTHPKGTAGLVDGLLEHWVFDGYLRRDFYRAVRDDVVLDIGAHIGLFSIRLALLFDDIKLFAFEPCKDTFRCLEENLRNFNCKNVTSFNLAVGAAEGRGTMQQGKRSLDNTLEPSTEGPVAVIPLKRAMELAGAERIAFLKVDIEGSEKQLFHAADPHLLNRIDRVVVEYHDNLVPGCLDVVMECLASTHRVAVEPSAVPGCGLLRAVRLDEHRVGN